MLFKKLAPLALVLSAAFVTPLCGQTAVVSSQYVSPMLQVYLGMPYSQVVAIDAAMSDADNKTEYMFDAYYGLEDQVFSLQQDTKTDPHVLAGKIADLIEQEIRLDRDYQRIWGDARKVVANTITPAQMPKVAALQQALNYEYLVYSAEYLGIIARQPSVGSAPVPVPSAGALFTAGKPALSLRDEAAAKRKSAKR